MKIITFLIAGCGLCATAFGQKARLDTEKHAACELFAQKSGYDWQQRLLQIDSLEGQEVTVFEIKGKNNDIKSTYTGKVTIIGKNSGKKPTKGDATVITVVEDLGGGKKSGHFPLTNHKNYRIYLRKCLE